jgi:hypothetical protein
MNFDDFIAAMNTDADFKRRVIEHFLNLPFDEWGDVPLEPNILTARSLGSLPTDLSGRPIITIKSPSA